MGYKRNPFVLGSWAPAYLAATTVAITNDFLMAAMFLLLTLGILGVYVTEFPVSPTLYQNEILHKAATSSLNKYWTFITIANYTRLLNDAAKSPLMENVGSKNQFWLGLGVAYRF